MGLSAADVADLTAAYDSNMAAMWTAITRAGRFSFQQFYTTPGLQYPMCGAPLVARATCATDLRGLCSASSPVQSRAVFAAYAPGGCSYAPAPPDFQQDLAAFLLWRGDFAWLGTSWIGCGSQDFAGAMPDALRADYGEPLALCAESAPGSGVFVREWSKASVSLDCAAWKGVINMKE